MIAALYPTKKALKEAVGQPLRYQETSIFGREYVADGVIVVVGPGPTDRRFYARVTMKDGLIAKVS